MHFYILAIEEVELPNYVETLWSGNQKEVREAPLLAKYRVDLQTPQRKIELFFELREQPNNGPLIDEYYEDQVYEALMAALSSIENMKERTRTYDQITLKISEALFDKFDGRNIDYPIQVSPSN